MCIVPNLNRDGFAVLRGFLELYEVGKAKKLLDPILLTAGEACCKRPHNTLLPLRWDSPLVELFLSSDRRVQALTRVSDSDDLRWISGYISIKEAHSPPLWWHQDWWCWDHPVSYQLAAPQMAVLCYLTDTNPQNGALRLLPGSHHQSTEIHAILPQSHSLTAENLDPRHPSMSDQSDQVTLSLSAGDAVIMDYRLLHGTHGNKSDLRRDCIILNFAPSWHQLPEDIKGHLIIHTALPSGSEAVPVSSVIWKFLPAFHGERGSLRVNRNAPAKFDLRS